MRLDQQKTFGVPTPLARTWWLAAGSLLLPLLFLLAGDGNLIRSAMLTGLSGLGLLLWLREGLQQPSVRLLALPLLLLLSVYVLMTPLGAYHRIPLAEGVRNTVQLMLVLGWIGFAASLDWRHAMLNRMATVCGVLLAANLLALVVLPQGLSPHKNATGALALVMIFFFIAGALARKQDGVPTSPWLTVGEVLAALLLMQLVGSRTPMLAAALGAGVYMALPLLAGPARGWLRVGFGLLVFAVLFTGVYVYTYLQDFGWYDALEQLVRDWTGQNLYSGRNLIWPLLFDAIWQAPWLGYGSGADPNRQFLSTWLDVTWSAHNLYLTIAIQVGLIGLAAFVGLLVYLFARLAGQNLCDPVIRLSAAFLVAVWVHQTFEVSLTQNNLVVGLALWLIPAVGVGRMLHLAAAGGHVPDADPAAPDSPGNPLPRRRKT